MLNIGWKITLTLENIVPHISSINLKILPSLIQDEEILSMNYTTPNGKRIFSTEIKKSILEDGDILAYIFHLQERNYHQPKVAKNLHRFTLTLISLMYNCLSKSCSKFIFSTSLTLTEIIKLTKKLFLFMIYVLINKTELL